MQVQSSSRDSSDLSGGSFSECDFTSSVDSGVDVREFSRVRSGRNSGSLPGSGKFCCECIIMAVCVCVATFCVCVYVCVCVSVYIQS